MACSLEKMFDVNSLITAPEDDSICDHDKREKKSNNLKIPLNIKIMAITLNSLGMKINQVFDFEPPISFFHLLKNSSNETYFKVMRRYSNSRGMKVLSNVLKKCSKSLLIIFEYLIRENYSKN